MLEDFGGKKHTSSQKKKSNMHDSIQTAADLKVVDTSRDVLTRNRASKIKSSDPVESSNAAVNYTPEPDSKKKNSYRK